MGEWLRIYFLKVFGVLSLPCVCVTIFVPLVALSDSALENYKVIKRDGKGKKEAKVQVPSTKRFFPRSFKSANFTTVSTEEKN